jgi:hypothetical protein
MRKETGNCLFSRFGKVELKMKYLTSSNVKCASHMKYRPVADVKYSPMANVIVTALRGNEKEEGESYLGG